MTDARRFAPATARNREPIRQALAAVLPTSGRVLEIASGSGEHAVHLARAFPALRFAPSDPDPAALASIAAWTRSEGAANVDPPLAIDVTAPGWHETVPPVDAVLCCNMIHIAPWAAAEGLLDGAAALLPARAPLCLYGPFKRGGEHTAESNAAFDASLRARDPAWGVRDLDDVVARAETAGLTLDRVIEMPANNLIAVLRRTDTTARPRSRGTS